MMRKLLLIAAVLLLASPAYPWGGSVMMVGGGTPAAAAGTTWIYSVEATDDYPNYTEEVTTVTIGGPVTTVGAVTFTKLSVKLNDPLTCTEGWVALYLTTGDKDRLAYATFTPAVGWNDVTISYAANAATTYWVDSGCNATRRVASYTGHTPQWYSTGYTYSSTPPGNLTYSTYGGRSIGARAGY